MTSAREPWKQEAEKVCACPRECEHRLHLFYTPATEGDTGYNSCSFYIHVKHFKVLFFLSHCLLYLRDGKGENNFTLLTNLALKPNLRQILESVLRQRRRLLVDVGRSIPHFVSGAAQLVAEISPMLIKPMGAQDGLLSVVVNLRGQKSIRFKQSFYIF